MGSKTKKIRASGRFRVGYGTNVRKSLNYIESRQRIKQKSSINPKGRAKRVASGIWRDVKTGKLFAGPSYYLENQ